MYGNSFGDLHRARFVRPGAASAGIHRGHGVELHAAGPVVPRHQGQDHRVRPALSAGLVAYCFPSLGISYSQIEWRIAFVWRVNAKSAATRTGALLNPCFLLLQVPSRAW